MQFVSCHNGQIFKTSAATIASPKNRTFVTGLSAIDTLMPGGAFPRGSVHEILSDPNYGTPRFFALLLAKSLNGVIVWCDPEGTLYPPAVAAAGVPMEKLYLLHPKTQADQSWAIAECMRCKGVSATIAQVGRLSRIEARRLQLAAEQGGGIGILLRPMDRNASVYAAASRWLVSPAQGLRTVQRWKIQLIHAHGGRIGQTVILEHHRETNTLRASEQLANRQSETVATEVA
jgi:protein ImuA